MNEQKLIMDKVIRVIGYVGISMILIVYLLIPLISLIFRTVLTEIYLPLHFWWSWTTIMIIWILSEKFTKLYKSNS